MKPSIPTIGTNSRPPLKLPAKLGLNIIGPKLGGTPEGLEPWLIVRKTRPNTKSSKLLPEKAWLYPTPRLYPFVSCEERSPTKPPDPLTGCQKPAYRAQILSLSLN